jgi:hypothetical protein
VAACSAERPVVIIFDDLPVQLNPDFAQAVNGNFIRRLEFCNWARSIGRRGDFFDNVEIGAA